MKPLFITAGSDSIDSLGLPAVGKKNNFLIFSNDFINPFQAGNMTPLDMLKKVSKDYFPPSNSELDKIYLEILKTIYSKK